MDRDTAEWLAGLIAQTVAGLEGGAGLTCEVRGDATRWAQVVPEEGDEAGRVGSILLNFAYRRDDEPLSALSQLGLKPPPGTEDAGWEAGGFARLLLRPDIPVVALALFVGDIFEKVLEAPPGYELQAWIEYGY